MSAKKLRLFIYLSFLIHLAGGLAIYFYYNPLRFAPKAVEERTEADLFPEFLKKGLLSEKGGEKGEADSEADSRAASDPAEYAGGKGERAEYSGAKPQARGSKAGSAPKTFRRQAKKQPGGKKSPRQKSPRPAADKNFKGRGAGLSKKSSEKSAGAAAPRKKKPEEGSQAPGGGDLASPDEAERLDLEGLETKSFDWESAAPPAASKKAEAAGESAGEASGGVSGEAAGGLKAGLDGGPKAAAPEEPLQLESFPAPESLPSAAPGMASKAKKAQIQEKQESLELEEIDFDEAPFDSSAAAAEGAEPLPARESAAGGPEGASAKTAAAAGALGGPGGERPEEAGGPAGNEEDERDEEGGEGGEDEEEGDDEEDERDDEEERDSEGEKDDEGEGDEKAEAGGEGKSVKPGPSAPNSSQRGGKFRDFSDLRQRRGNPSLAYPEIFRKKKIQGTVSVVYFVDKSGLVEQIQVKSSSGHADLDNFVQRSLVRYKFLPGQEGWVRHNVEFRLEGVEEERLRLRERGGESGS